MTDRPRSRGSAGKTTRSHSQARASAQHPTPRRTTSTRSTSTRSTSKPTTAVGRPSGRSGAGRSTSGRAARPSGVPSSRMSDGRTSAGATSARRSVPASSRVASGSQARRRRLPLGVAAVIALVIVATSFPFSDFVHQHRAVAAEAAQLSQLQRANALLAEKRRQLSSDAEVKRLARQNYQLVSPGQALYEVLPPSGGTRAPMTAGSPVAGDPADQPLYDPANAPSATPDPGLPAALPVSSGSTTATPSPSTSPAPTGGFWSRVTSTLQFWK